MAKIYAGRHTYKIFHIFAMYPTLRDEYSYSILYYSHTVYNISACKGSPGYCYKIKVYAPDEYIAYIFLLDMGYYDIQIL